MEIYETYEYLKQIRRINLQIKQYNLRLLTLKSCLLPGAIDYSADKVQSTPNDKLTEVMAECAELEEKITDVNVHKFNLIKELTTAINLIANEVERAVLTAYYVDGISMNKTAELVGYEIAHTYRLRRLGVRHLSDKL